MDVNNMKKIPKTPLTHNESLYTFDEPFNTPSNNHNIGIISETFDNNNNITRSSSTSPSTGSTKHYRSEDDDDELNDYDNHHLINKISKINTDDSIHTIVTNGKHSRSRIRGRSDDDEFENDEYSQNTLRTTSITNDIDDDDENNLGKKIHRNNNHIFKQPSNIRNNRINQANIIYSGKPGDDIDDDDGIIDSNQNINQNNEDIINNINNLSFNKKENSNSINSSNSAAYNFLLLSNQSPQFQNIYLPTFHSLENLHIDPNKTLPNNNNNNNNTEIDHSILTNQLFQQQQQQLYLFSNLLNQQQQIIQQQQLQQQLQQHQQFQHHHQQPNQTILQQPQISLPTQTNQTIQPTNQSIQQQQQNNQQESNPFSRIFIICGKEITEQQLTKTFKKHGIIESCKVVLDKNTNESKGYAYIKYQKTSSAALAIEELNGTFLSKDDNSKNNNNENNDNLNNQQGNLIKVMVAEAKGSKSKPIASTDPEDNPPNSRLFVVCKKDSTETEIYNKFKSFGNLEYVKLVRERDTNESKGCAFVKFSKFSNAAFAFESINNEQDDKSTKVIFAQPKIRYSSSKLSQSNDNLNTNNLNTNNLLPSFQMLSTNTSNNQPNQTNQPNQNNQLYLDYNQQQSHSTNYPVSRQRLFVVCHKSITQENLYRLFSKYPGMEYCDLKKDKITNKSKGFAYVNYSTPQAALLAKNELNGIKYPPGHSLKVVFAEPLGFKQAPNATIDHHQSHHQQTHFSNQLQYLRMNQQPTPSSNSSHINQQAQQSQTQLPPSTTNNQNINNTQSDRKRQKIMFNTDNQ